MCYSCVCQSFKQSFHTLSFAVSTSFFLPSSVLFAIALRCSQPMALIFLIALFLLCWPPKMLFSSSIPFLFKLLSKITPICALFSETLTLHKVDSLGILYYFSILFIYYAVLIRLDTSFHFL